MKCALCGYRYDARDGQEGCRGCPLAHGCTMLRCPNCGYEVPAESRRVHALKKVIAKWT